MNHTSNYVDSLSKRFVRGCPIFDDIRQFNHVWERRGGKVVCRKCGVEKKTVGEVS